MLFFPLKVVLEEIDAATLKGWSSGVVFPASGCSLHLVFHPEHTACSVAACQRQRQNQNPEA